MVNAFIEGRWLAVVQFVNLFLSLEIYFGKKKERTNFNKDWQLALRTKRFFLVLLSLLYRATYSLASDKRSWCVWMIRYAIRDLLSGRAQPPRHQRFAKDSDLTQSKLHKNCWNFKIIFFFGAVGETKQWPNAMLPSIHKSILCWTMEEYGIKILSGQLWKLRRTIF